jgi:RNA binding exosome subunit
MGQYYKIVNIKKKQYISPYIFGDGAKLMEFSMSASGVLAGLSILLADGNGRGGGDLHSENDIVGSWAGDNIVIAGDYADSGKFVKEIGQNLYEVASNEGEDISIKVLDALFDDQYFFSEFRKNRAGWSNNSEVDDLIKRKLKEKGLSETKKHKIQSSKDPNIQYNVSEDNGNWECDCPSYTYSGGNECKHIKQLKTA